jgi:hypothetical protein
MTAAQRSARASSAATTRWKKKEEKSQAATYTAAPGRRWRHPDSLIRRPHPAPRA